MTDSDTIDRLRSLIEAEREALLCGDFDRIETLLEEKEALATGLGDSIGDDETLAPLRAGLRRNQELFDHALAGLRNVANRLGHLNALRKSLDTYDEFGRRMTIDAPGEHKLERRA